ncbi:MAG TPA: hypothetical protein VEB66_16905 [Opitutaceae bacterium]|nr:hypothetical protein [Opitutaceae bacterium]
MRAKNLREALHLTRKQNARLFVDELRLTRQAKLKVRPGTKTFYDEAKAFLESAGYDRLGDYRMTSMPRGTPANLTPLRVYLSPDRETVADAFYYQASLETHMNAAFGGAPMPLTYDFVTEFEDGGFLSTSNAEAASVIEQPKSAQNIFLPAYTPASKVLGAHRKALAKEKKRGRRPILITNEAEWKGSAGRLHRLKSEFRQRIGHARMSEIKAVKKRRDDAHETLLKALGALAELADAATADPKPRRKARR